MSLDDIDIESWDDGLDAGSQDKTSGVNEAKAKKTKQPRQPTVSRPIQPIILPSVPTGAIRILLRHCENTCDAQRKRNHDWVNLEIACDEIREHLGMEPRYRNKN